jgi:hypothetical protein
MAEAIINLLPLLIGVVFTALCISAIADSDGRCHNEDCDGCPYSGWCDEQERRKRGETDGRDYDQHG